MKTPRLILVALLLAAVTAMAAPPLPMAFGVSYYRSVKSHQNGVGVKLPTDLGQHLRVEPEIIYRESSGK